MSCNPSIGGLAKGHMVKEIDALGGIMGLIADKTTIQFKRLNTRKGPAVRGTRVQCDKNLYCQEMANFLQSRKNMEILENEVASLMIDGNRVYGVILKDGVRIKSRTVVIATGTFMNAIMHIGTKKIQGGRVGEKASLGLSDQLTDRGFEVLRLKRALHQDFWKKVLIGQKPGPSMETGYTDPLVLKSKNADFTPDSLLSDKHH